MPPRKGPSERPIPVTAYRIPILASIVLGYMIGSIEQTQVVKQPSAIPNKIRITIAREKYKILLSSHCRPTERKLQMLISHIPLSINFFLAPGYAISDDMLIALTKTPIEVEQKISPIRPLSSPLYSSEYCEKKELAITVFT